jgi:8-oxo-dGTP pyrophosphatase MutT (NUDIX family)
MTEYVLGFVFNSTGDYVLLMQKQKPKWQAGFWNGIGGKIEPDETAYHAMVREANEEIGLTDADWKVFAELHGKDFRVVVFKAFIGMDDLQACRAQEEEPIYVFATHALPKPEMITNLRWLIPLALDPTNDSLTINYA